MMSILIEGKTAKHLFASRIPFCNRTFKIPRETLEKGLWLMNRKAPGSVPRIRTRQEMK